LETQVAEEQAEDDREGGGLARVIQEVAEDSRSRFENFKQKITIIIGDYSILGVHFF
jgi:hydrogenase maturation factor